MTSVISMGCLRNENGNPLVDGLLLLEMLGSQGPVVISLRDRDSDPECKAWLLQRRITTQYQLRTDSMYGVTRFRRHLEIERAIGRVRLAVTPDPEEARWAFEEGIACLLYLDRGIVDPRMRPGEIRPWDEVVDSIDGRYR